jgi:cation:H+ antiporter
VAILVNLSISLREAFALFGLFWAQFVLTAVVPPSFRGTELLVLSGVYILLGLWLLARKHGDFPHLLRDGFRTPYEKMERETEAAAEGPSQSQVTK